jgi:hypothetical protein
MPVNVQRRALVALGMLWLGGVPAFAAEDVDVRGVWSSLTRTGEGGISGEQMIFTSKFVTITEGILLDSTYAIDGDKITITPRDERLGAPQAGEFRVAGNRMRLDLAGARPRIMTRAGKILYGSDPIVGDWTWPFLSQDWRFVQRFSRNGTSQLALPFDTDRGIYSIAGDTMDLDLIRNRDLARTRAVRLTVKREGNLLVTRDADGQEKQFVRFEYDHLVA